ncbi:MAG: MFS transporter [Chloroflexi bacterium]|nr:MFS transporter [Chloroflexota bacterium]
MLPPALRHLDFRLFWAGLVLSAVGTQFTTVAMAWQIYELTNSPLQIGFLGLARAVPQIGLALLGGLLADAIDRRRLMVFAQLAQLSVSLLLAVLSFAGAVTPEMLYAAAVLSAFAGTLEQPARQALVPNLVPREDLTSAMALNSAQRNVGMTVGPPLAGLLLSIASPSWCYAANAATWVAMLGVLLLIRSRAQAMVGRAGVSLNAVKEGFAFLLTQPVILAFMVLDFGATFFGSSTALYPVYARDILAVGPTGLGILYASNSIGSLVAALAMGMAATPRRTGLWVLVPVTCYAICTMVFAFSQDFLLSVLMLAGTGAGNMVGSVVRGTTNQVLTPDQLRGRVAAVNSVFTMGGPQLGQFESGVAAALLGTQASAFVGGLGALAVVVGVAMVPQVRHFSLVEGTKTPEAAT